MSAVRNEGTPPPPTQPATPSSFNRLSKFLSDLQEMETNPQRYCQRKWTEGSGEGSKAKHMTACLRICQLVADLNGWIEKP